MADLLAFVAVPRPRLLDDPRFGGNVEDETRVANAFGVHDVELGLLEWRRHFVLHDFHAHVRADDVLLLLHRTNPPNVEAHRRVELERLTSSRRFRIAEHDADFLAQLIDEDYRRL